MANFLRLSDAERLSYVSSGQVSKGLYMQNELNRSISPRNHLVEIPADVQFDLPSIPETSLTFEFLNREVSEQFECILNNHNGGISLATKFADAICHLFSTKKSDIAKLKASKDPCFQKWLYRELSTLTFVPTVSVRLESTNHCKLSSLALHKLQKLEQCFQRTNYEVEFFKQCEEFFMEFGSHYFIGTYHLGGLRKYMQIENVVQVKEGVNNSQVNVKYDICGGSPPDDNIWNWKRSLIGKPYNWCVIDKEESSSMNYRAVWKLIGSDHFKLQSQFSNALHEAWKYLTGLNINPEIDGTDFIFESKLKNIEEGINRDILRLKEPNKLIPVPDIINKQNYRIANGAEIKIRQSEFESLYQDFDLSCSSSSSEIDIQAIEEGQNENSDQESHENKEEVKINNECHPNCKRCKFMQLMSCLLEEDDI